MTSTSAVSQWLDNASRYPLLTATQEIQLGGQIRAWLDVENPDARTIKRGKRARERMIQSNLRLCAAASKKYLARIGSSSSLSHEDLLQEACLGLARAAEKFDPATGYKFSTYAYWWIRQAIGRLCDYNSSPIKITPPVHQMALKWQYRPEGQSIEEFAAGLGEPVEKIKRKLEWWRRAQVSSLDCHAKSDDDSSPLIDRIAADELINNEQDFAEILDDLKYLDGGVLRESLAVLEVAEEAKPAEIAELMGWGRHEVQRKLQDCRSQVREHLPDHIRAMICGPEHKIEPAIIDASPSPKPEPVRELVLAHASASTTDSPMTSSIQPTTNGHSKSLEAEALEIIETVKAEPAEVQLEPPAKAKRKRRSAAEIQAEKESALISVVVDGTQFAGQPDHIARLLVAMKAA